MAKAQVTTAKIVRLFQKHQSLTKVSKLVKRHITSVRARLVRAGVIKGSIGQN